ncbi:MAG: hypothetical protein ACXW31_17425, partial [Thermoanaerobaculia bacterium]
GIARWAATWRRYALDVSCASHDAVLLAGERDPLPDRTCTPVVPLPGAHACVFSHATEVADALRSAGILPAATPASSRQG